MLDTEEDQSSDMKLILNPDECARESLAKDDLCIKEILNVKSDTNEQHEIVNGTLGESDSNGEASTNEADTADEERSSEAMEHQEEEESTELPPENNGSGEEKSVEDSIKELLEDASDDGNSSTEVPKADESPFNPEDKVDTTPESIHEKDTQPGEDVEKVAEESNGLSADQSIISQGSPIVKEVSEESKEEDEAEKEEPETEKQQSVEKDDASEEMDVDKILAEVSEEIRGTSTGDDEDMDGDTDVNKEEPLASCNVETSAPDDKQCDDIKDLKPIEKDEKAAAKFEDEIEIKNDTKPSEETKTVDYEEALTSLTSIAKTNKKIFDDDVTPVRKSPSNNVTKDEAKVIKRIKKNLKKFSRGDLEELFITKMAEAITQKSEIGRLRKQCDNYDITLDKWKTRTLSLQKQCQDLNTVMRKYITDINQKKEKVAPIKITRSVGLQVQMGGANSMAARRQLTAAGPGTRPGLANRQPQQQAMRRPVQPSPIRPASQQQSRPQQQKSPMQQQTPPKTGTSAVAAAAAATTSLGKAVQINSVSITKTSSSTPPSTAPPTKRKSTTPVFEVVDLSDDESGGPAKRPKPIAPRPGPQNGNRTPMPARQPMIQNGTAQVRYMGPKNISQPQTFIMQGSTLIPVTAAQAPPPTRVRVQNRPSLNGSNIVRPRSAVSQPRVFQAASAHPAALPLTPNQQNSHPGWKKIPPRPTLKLSKLQTGIVLSWNMDGLSKENADISSYQIYAYQETAGTVPNTSMWKKVGDVKALPLPMACTLTQFTAGNRYHFAVRAVDTHRRIGPFSQYQSISLT